MTAAKKQILTYIFQTIGVDDSLVDPFIAAGVTTPRILAKTSAANLKKFLADGTATEIQLDELMRFRRWLKQCKASQQATPRTLDAWKATFTEEAFDTFCDQEEEAEDEDLSQARVRPLMVAAPAPTSPVNQATTMIPSEPKKTIKVSLSDFPEFNGNQSQWKTFKKEVISTMGLLKQLELLKVQNEMDVILHKTKLASDPTYKTQVEEFFSILSKKTAKGTATSWADTHEDTSDGVLVWKEMCKYYDHGGDKNARATTLLTELTALSLYNDSHGGFDRYHNQFTGKHLELHKIGHPVDDMMKKTLFLNGIRDPSYDAVKDDCKKEGFAASVDLLRSKAIDLGKAQRHTRVNNKRNNDDDGSLNDSEDEVSLSGSETDDDSIDRGAPSPLEGSGFGDEVWDMMTKANRKWILKHKERDKLEAKKQDIGSGFSEELWKEMTPENREWIKMCQNKENQGSPQEEGSPESNEDSGDDRHSNNVTIHTPGSRNR